MCAKQNSSSRRSAARSGSGFVADFRRGRGLSLDFFKKNAWIILFFVVVIVMLIGLRYKTKVHMMQITRLERELDEAENRKIREKALYMSLIRETDMVRLVQSGNLGLIFQEKPPYQLSLDDGLENDNDNNPQSQP